MCLTNVLSRFHPGGVLANLMSQQKNAAYSLVPPETYLWSWFCFLPLCKPVLAKFSTPLLSPDIYLYISKLTSIFSHTFLTWGHWELETKTLLSWFPSELQRKFCKTRICKQVCVQPQLQEVTRVWLVTSYHQLKTCRCQPRNALMSLAIFLHHPELHIYFHGGVSFELYWYWCFQR